MSLGSVKGLILCENKAVNHPPVKSKDSYTANSMY